MSIEDTIQTIDIGDMQVPIEPKFLYEEYPGSERDMAVFMVQSYYKTIAVKLGKDARSAALQHKALVYAKWYAVRRMTQEMPSLVHRSTMFLLDEAEQTGWYHDLEYDTLEELLASVYSDKEGMTEAYDWKFIIQQILPAAEDAGIPASIFMNASLQIRKIRNLVPAVRELFKRSESDMIGPQELRQTLGDWLGDTANPNITSSQLKEKLETWRGLSVRRKEPIKGQKMLMLGGKWWVVMECDDTELAMIEQALYNRVDLSISDIGWLLKRIKEVMKMETPQVKSITYNPVPVEVTP